MALDLAPVAVDRVGKLFRRRVLEMHRLAGEGTQAAGDEEEPRQELWLVGRSADEAPGFFAEIEQDGARIEHPRLDPARPFGVDDRGHLAVRIDGAKSGRVLLALARIDRDDFVGEAELLQQERDLGGIGGGVEIEADHGALQMWDG